MTRRSAGAIERRRLFERIDDEGEREIVWIHGPAGSGKSLLVSSYLAQARQPALWYQVDAADIDAATVFSFLAEGAVHVAPKRRRPALPAWTPVHQFDIPGFSRRFFRRLFDVLPAQAAVVLDSLENEPAGVLQNLLLLALDEMGPGQRFFVTSRESPPDCLAHLPLKGRMTLIGWDELRLTPDEAHSLAARDGSTPSEWVGRLHEATAGWAAGFMLMLTHLRRTGRLELAPASVLADRLFPYYLNELFARTDEPTQTLLMRTALLPGFSVEQATALAPSAPVAAALDWLVRRHFFITRSSGENSIYRYHAMFREFLLQQGRERLPVDLRGALLLQAAELLVAAEDEEAALPLLMDGQAWPQAARLVCKLAPRLLAQGRMTTVTNFIAALTRGTSEVSGEVEHWLHYWSGMATLAGEPERARGDLEAAYAGFERDGDATGQLLACASILDTYLYAWNELRPVDRWAETLLRLLQPRRPEFPPAVEIKALSSLMVLNFRGHRHAELIEAGCARALELLTRTDEPALRFGVAALVLMKCYFRGAWHEGLRFAAEVESTLPDAAAMPQNIAFWHAMKARLMVWQGDFEAAFACTELAEKIAADHNIRALATLTASVGAFAAVNAGDLERAEPHLARMRQGVLPSRRLDVATVDLQYGLLALARGQVHEATGYLQAATRVAVDCGAELLAAQFRIPLGAALVLGGHFDEARELQQRVLDHAGAARLPVLEHGATLVLAWLAHRRGDADAARECLSTALPLGRHHRWRVIFPWAPVVMMQELALLALLQGLESGHVEEMIRLRRIPPPSPDVDGWPWRVRVRTLGHFELSIDGRPIVGGPKAPKKPLEMLKAVVGHAGAEGISQSALEEQLWPDLDGAAARNASNVALHRLRKLLGDDDAVLLYEGRLRLNGQAVWTDLESFRRLTDELGAGRLDVLAADRLLAVYGGHFLPDDESPWVVLRREQLRSRFLRAAARLTESLEREGRRGETIEFQRRLIEIEPLAEVFHRNLMRSLVALGRPVEALEAYRRCRELLWRVLGAMPSDETERLRCSIGR